MKEQRREGKTEGMGRGGKSGKYGFEKGVRRSGQR
jgi:hypothetical protein